MVHLSVAFHNEVQMISGLFVVVIELIVAANVLLIGFFLTLLYLSLLIVCKIKQHREHLRDVDFVVEQPFRAIFVNCSKLTSVDSFLFFLFMFVDEPFTPHAFRKLDRFGND